MRSPSDENNMTNLTQPQSPLGQRILLWGAAAKRRFHAPLERSLDTPLLSLTRFTGFPTGKCAMQLSSRRW